MIKMIVVKTNMLEIPESCNECSLCYKTFGVWLCPLLKNWIEHWEIKAGKKKLDNCPLEEQ